MRPTEFDHDQFDEAYPPGIERSWWSLARNHVITRTFERHVPRDAHVLEVGCGTGIVTAHLRAKGWNVMGADLGRPTAGVRDPEHVMLGTNALELPVGMRERFTVLCLFDVIEHVADAPAFLRSLLAAFRNATLVVVTVPARQELWTSFDDHYGHFRRYDRSMLRDEFTRADLLPLEVGYFFHAVYPAISVNNLVRGRKRNIRFNAPSPGFATILNSAIASAFAIGSRLLPSSVVGSSIIGVARRA